MKKKIVSKPTKKKVNARQVGHSFERDLVKELRELLNDETIATSRYASRALDDAKVDIYGTEKYGFSVQAKRYTNTPNLFKVLGEMPKDDCINTIFWKKPNVGQLVIMDKNDFYKLISKLNEK